MRSVILSAALAIAFIQSGCEETWRCDPERADKMTVFLKECSESLPSYKCQDLAMRMFCKPGNSK